MDTRVIGHIAEIRTVHKLLELGYQVLNEIVPQGKTDYWIRCEGDTYIKLQVKKVREKFQPGKGRTKRMKIAGKLGKTCFARPYSKDEVDFFIGVSDVGFYVVPRDVAYGGISKKNFNVNRHFLEAWNLLPKPYEAIEEPVGVEEESRQGMLFVA